MHAVVEAARSAHAHAIKALRAEFDPPGTAVERAKHAARRLADMIRGLTGPGGPEDRSEVWGEVYNEVGKDGQRRCCGEENVSVQQRRWWTEHTSPRH